MRHLDVESVMTPQVVTASPKTSFKELAWLLSRHGISGMPIVDEETRLVGIVTEADLLRAEGETGAPARLLDRLFAGRRRTRKTADLRAADLMTRGVVTVQSNTRLRDAVMKLLRTGVKRLPVVDAHNRVVGIVSRVDLLAPFLRTDDEIRREIIDDLLVSEMWLEPGTIGVEVDRGVVRLQGELEPRDTKDILVELVGRIDGVVGVVDEIRSGREDGHRPTTHPRRVAMPAGRGTQRMRW